MIKGECTQAELNSISQIYSTCDSPNYDFISQLNPFVLHGDNLCILLAPNEICNENLIALQNCSKHCIKFEWQELCKVGDSIKLPIEIHIEPSNGYLKGGFTKLFRITIKSTGIAIQLQTIPIKCIIYQYQKEYHREINMPDGYFEYTERGYFEKVCALLNFYLTPLSIFIPHQPHNWTPNCLHYLHTLYLNVNINVLNCQMKRKYHTTLNRHHVVNIENHMPSIAIVTDDDNLKSLMTHKMSHNDSDDEKLMMETLIR